MTAQMQDCWVCNGTGLLVASQMLEVQGDRTCFICNGIGKVPYEIPVKLKCYICGTVTDQQNIILTSKGNLCLCCDPESLKQIPRMDIIGVL